MKKIDDKPVDDLRGAGGSGGGGGTPHRTPDNIRMQDWMECVLGLGHGPIRGLAPGIHNKLENFFVGDTPIFNSGTGLANYPNFRLKVYSGADTDPAINFTLGGAASNQTVNVQLAYNIPVVRTTSVLQRGRIDRLEIRLVFQRLVRITDKQATYDGTAEFRIEYKPSNSSTWSLYNGQNVSTMTGKTSSQAPKDFIIEVPRLTDDDWDVRITKLTPENNADTGTFADFVFESIQTVETTPKKYDDIAVVHLLGRATSQFSSVPDFYGIYDGLIVSVPSNYDPATNTYDESTPWNGMWKRAWSDCPPFILRELILNPIFGLATYFLHVSVVDSEFYNAGKWCDTRVPVGTTGRMRRRFTMNMVVTEAMQGMEFLRYLAGSFNSTIFDDGNGNISLRTDMPTAPVYIFTPENISDDGFNYSYTDVTTRHNDITVVFANKELGYNEDRRKATIDNTEAVALNGIVPYEFVAVGCDNVDEAVARANYRYMIANTEVATVSMNTTRLGMLLDVFDTIYVADPRAGWSTGGRIKSVSGNTLHLRDPIYFTTQAQVTLRVQTFEGLKVVQANPTVQGVNYTLTLASAGALPEGTYPDRTTFTVEDTTTHGLAKPFRIIAIDEVEGSMNSYAITAIEVNINKYPDADLGVESEQVDYSYQQPGEPILPPELLLETGTAHIITGNDGTLINRIYASWEKPLQAFTAYYEIDFKLMEDSTWTTVKATENDAFLSPVQDDMLYHIRLYAVAPTGKRSRDYLERINFRVSGKSIGLDVPTGVAVEQTETGYRFSWDSPVGGDYDGMEIRQGGVNNVWDTARTIARRLKDNAFQYQWLAEGEHRFFFKYRNTSNNESNQAATIDIEVIAPPAPIVKAETRNGLLSMLWDPVAGTQPTDFYAFRWGTADTPPSGATAVAQTGASSLTIPLNDPTIRKGHLRAVDRGGNVSPWTSYEIGMEDTVDPTPPPTVTGLEAHAAINSITIVTDPATYKVGHGHRNTRLYAAQITTALPDPVFNESYFVGTFQGSVETFPATIGTRWRFWAKWTTNDGYDSLQPSSPAEAETGKIGDNQLAEDLDFASKLADGSISGSKLAAGAIDATKFAQGIEPVTIVPGVDVPTEKVTSQIVVDGQSYIWDEAQGKYIKPGAGSISAEDIEGLIEAGQLKDGSVTSSKIAAGAVDTTKFANGLEPITVIDGPTLPTVKSTSTISWQGNLYRWDATEGEYVKSVQAVDINGQLVTTQISDNAISTDKILANAIQTSHIQAGAIKADQIAANAITTSKLMITGAGDNLIPDPFFGDAGLWRAPMAGGTGPIPNIVTSPEAYSGGRFLEAEGDNYQMYDNFKIPIDPKKQYLIETVVMPMADSAGRFFGVWRFFDANGVAIDTFSDPDWPGQVAPNNYAPSYIEPPKEVWTRYAYTIGLGAKMGIPTNAAYVSWGYITGYLGGTAGKTRIGRMSITELKKGELIVDGGITADKIAAGAITADKIAANSITASKIQLTDPMNYYPDYDFMDDGSITATVPGQTVSFEYFHGDNTGRRLLHLPALAVKNPRVAYEFTGVPVEPSAEYYFQGNAKCADADIGFYTREFSQDASGNLVPEAPIARMFKVKADSFGVVSASFTTKPGTKRMSFYFERAAGGSAYGYVGGVILRRKAGVQLLSDGSISAEKLQANAVTAGKIAAGAVNAREIAAGAITADKLVVGGARDIITHDPMFTDRVVWENPSHMLGSLGLVGTQYSIQGGAIVENTNRGEVHAYWDNKKVPIDPTRDYVFEQSIVRDAAATGNYYGVVRFWDGNGVFIASESAGQLGWPAVGSGNYYNPSYATLPAGLWTQFRAFFGPGYQAKIPSNARYVSIGFLMAYGGGTGTWYVGQLQIREMVKGDLIVSGAITADKLAANSIAVGTAAVQDAAITNAMIANLSADKINTGYLNAARIQAGTINAGHLAANSVTADKIVAGSIDSTKIAARSITADRLVAGQISAYELVANNAFIQDGTLQGAKIGAAQIGTAHIQDLSVLTAKIGVAQIDTLRIANAAVVTGQAQGWYTGVGSSGGTTAVLGSSAVYMPYGGTLLVFAQAKYDGGSWGFTPLGRVPGIVISVNGQNVIAYNQYRDNQTPISYTLLDGATYIMGPLGGGSYTLTATVNRPGDGTAYYSVQVAILGFQR